MSIEKKISDEELKKVNVKQLKFHNATINLVEYNSDWPVLFQREAIRIREILGNRALQVEHVGSTSVPGLCAKPIIDLVLVVEDSSNEASYVTDLEAAGYWLKIREPEWLEHRMLKGPDTDINLHVFSQGEDEIKKMLIYRDWLRKNENDRELYANTKRELAKKTWRHIQHYADSKGTVVQKIMANAMSEKLEE